MITDDLENRSEILSISQLNRRVKNLLEIHFALIWVEGELSNFSHPASGHWYFSLKDAEAQVNCAMFKRRNSLIKFSPKVGEHYKVRARVSLYEGRGDYQLIIEHMEQAGFGLLHKRFEELKEKLKNEGFFDPAFKKPLPLHIKKLAVITSPTGAAIRDVLSVLKRRYPLLAVTIIPAIVQGEGAPESLIKAIQIADKEKHFDCILLCRGGGSLEDLWCFNNEVLAKTIFACDTPIVSAVGHETDFTIADFVADLRAATPSAAAELLSPDSDELLQKLGHFENRLTHLGRSLIEQHKKSLLHLRKRLRHPRDKIEQWQQQMDRQETLLIKAIRLCLKKSQTQINALSDSVQRLSPRHTIEHEKAVLMELSLRLKQQIGLSLKRKDQQFKHGAAALHIVSPLATLQRGYSITRNDKGTIVRQLDQVQDDEHISVTLHDGELHAQVNKRQKFTR